MADESMQILADKYFKNKHTPQEAEKVLNWFRSIEGSAYLKVRLSEDIQLLENETLVILPANVKSAEMFSNIVSTIEEKELIAKVRQPAKIIDAALKLTPARNRRFRSWYWAAAVVSGVSLILFTYNFYNKRVIFRSTGYGETARIILPDSSAITLNGNSEIEYPSHWDNDQSRKIKLRGEAFFAVKHKLNNQKFIVETADTIQIEVLGTEFNISDRKQHIEVVLLSGKIRLNVQHQLGPNDSLILKPGESVYIHPNNSLVHRKHIDPAVAVSWTSDKLLFDNTPVREICERLKDTYGYKIKSSDQSVLDQRVTGSVPNQNIDQVLSGLEAILAVKFTKEAN